MISFFQMITTANGTGTNLSDNKKSIGNGGENLFSMLLSNLNASAETCGKSSGLSLLSCALPAGDSIIADENLSPATDPVIPSDKTGKHPDRTSFQSSDFLLPGSAMSDIVAFLESKGFSTEQIDSIVLSSRNDEGLIQIHRLVAATQSARTGNVSGDSGLGVEMPLVPRVQELLLNMGLGVGEVREIVEQSKNETGGISLEKLTDSLNEHLFEPITNTEMVSLLEQNNISVTPQVSETVAAAVEHENIISINTQDAGTATVIPVREKAAADYQWPHGRETAGSAEKNDVVPNRDAPAAESAASALESKPENASQAYQDRDINKAALELKKEFMDFVDRKTNNAGQTGTLKTAVEEEGKAAQLQDAKALKESQAALNMASRLTKTIARESTQEASPINQVLSKGQEQWRKGVQEKIIDILKGEDQANVKGDNKGVIREQNGAMKDPGEFLKRGDQKTGQDILSAGSGSKTSQGTLPNEVADFKENLLSLRETQALDPISQNISNIREDIASKTQTKGAYNLPEPLPKVFDRMVIMIRNGEQSGKLMIQPPELGRIDIDLSIKNGHVQANLTTENIAVKEIIEANLNQLKQQLNDQGLIVEQFNVSVGSQNRQFREDFGHGWSNGYGSSRSDMSGTEEVAAATDEGSSPGMMNSRYRIDVRV